MWPHHSRAASSGTAIAPPAEVAATASCPCPAWINRWECAPAMSAAPSGSSSRRWLIARTMSAVSASREKEALSRSAGSSAANSSRNRKAWSSLTRWRSPSRSSVSRPHSRTVSSSRYRALPSVSSTRCTSDFATSELTMSADRARVTSPTAVAPRRSNAGRTVLRLATRIVRRTSTGGGVRLSRRSSRSTWLR